MELFFALTLLTLLGVGGRSLSKKYGAPPKGTFQVLYPNAPPGNVFFFFEPPEQKLGLKTGDEILFPMMYEKYSSNINDNRNPLMLVRGRIESTITTSVDNSNIPPYSKYWVTPIRIVNINSNWRKEDPQPFPNQGAVNMVHNQFWEVLDKQAVLID